MIHIELLSFLTHPSGILIHFACYGIANIAYDDKITNKVHRTSSQIFFLMILILSSNCVFSLFSLIRKLTLTLSNFFHAHEFKCCFDFQFTDKVFNFLLIKWVHRHL